MNEVATALFMSAPLLGVDKELLKSSVGTSLKRGGVNIKLIKGRLAPKKSETIFFLFGGSSL